MFNPYTNMRIVNNVWSQKPMTNLTLSRRDFFSIIVNNESSSFTESMVKMIASSPR